MIHIFVTKRHLQSFLLLEAVGWEWAYGYMGRKTPLELIAWSGRLSW